MLKAEIKRGTEQEKGCATITAVGGVPELLNDVAVLISGIYNQFNAVSPASAALFRTGIENMAKDTNSPLWQAVDGQTGIVLPKNK